MSRGRGQLVTTERNMQVLRCVGPSITWTRNIEVPERNSLYSVGLDAIMVNDATILSRSLLSRLSNAEIDIALFPGMCVASLFTECTVVKRYNDTCLRPKDIII